jgi:hypothetical protein
VPGPPCLGTLPAGTYQGGYPEIVISDTCNKLGCHQRCWHPNISCIYIYIYIYIFINMPPEAWYEMHVKPWHPKSATGGTRAPSFVECYIYDTYIRYIYIYIYIYIYPAAS